MADDFDPSLSETGANAVRALRAREWAFSVFRPEPGNRLPVNAPFDIRRHYSHMAARDLLPPDLARQFFARFITPPPQEYGIEQSRRQISWHLLATGEHRPYTPPGGYVPTPWQEGARYRKRYASRVADAIDGAVHVPAFGIYGTGLLGGDPNYFSSSTTARRLDWHYRNDTGFSCTPVPLDVEQPHGVIEVGVLPAGWEDMESYEITEQTQWISGDNIFEVLGSGLARGRITLGYYRGHEYFLDDENAENRIWRQNLANDSACWFIGVHLRYGNVRVKFPDLGLNELVGLDTTLFTGGTYRDGPPDETGFPFRYSNSPGYFAEGSAQVAGQYFQFSCYAGFIFENPTPYTCTLHYYVESWSEHKQRLAFEAEGRTDTGDILDAPGGGRMTSFAPGLEIGWNHVTVRPHSHGRVRFFQRLADFLAACARFEPPEAPPEPSPEDAAAIDLVVSVGFANTGSSYIYGNNMHYDVVAGTAATRIVESWAGVFLDWRAAYVTFDDFPTAHNPADETEETT
jgi:hypothetical protein